MPNAAYQQIFHHRVITKLIRELQSPAHLFCNTFNCQIGGSAEYEIDGTEFGWDIFNRSRQIPQGRLQNAGPATTAPQKIGHKNATMYRMHERIPLEINRLFRNRAPGAAFGTVDERGQTYAREQIRFQREKFMNGREAMMAMMFRGGFDIAVSGDSYNLVASGSGDHSVDYGHPAINRGDVETTFAGNWQTAASAAIIDELIGLNAHSANHSRFQIKHGFVNATGALHILKADSINDYTGTANVVTYDSRPPNFEDGTTNVMSFVIRAYPTITFHVYDDHFLLSDGTSQMPFIEDGKAIFTPEPSSEWLEYRTGTELVQEGVGKPIRTAQGTTMWTEWERNPVSMNLIALENSLPVPLIPSAWYYPTIHA